MAWQEELGLREGEVFLQEEVAVELDMMKEEEEVEQEDHLDHDPD